MNKGVFYAIGAYVLWGVFPLYWKALQTVPAIQILGHRIVWSLLFLLILVVSRREGTQLLQVFRSPKTLLIFGLSACLIGVNWFTYIWAVNAGFIVETSLGYFINPLMNVLLGVILLRERLRRLQWASVSLAGAGVLYLTLSYGELPWIALLLAFTFAIYGLVKKFAPLAALPGLTLETAILFLPALAFLLASEWRGAGAFGHQEGMVTALLALSGVVTATPLLFFATAARRIDLSLLGIFQYISPTCQFLLGVLLYKEPFDQARLVGFILIWLALLSYAVEGVIQSRRLNHLHHKRTIRPRISQRV